MLMRSPTAVRPPGPRVSALRHVGKLEGTSKNRRERQQISLRSAAVREYSEHRRRNLQRAAGFSTCPWLRSRKKVR